VFITSLTFIPAILLMMTSFTRIIIVFGLLRNALGPLPPAKPGSAGAGAVFDLFHYVAGYR
jgi:flagellar biosynthetic protein FliP